MRTTAVYLLALALILLTPDAQAVTFQSRSFDELVSIADRIFVGTVAKLSCRRTQNGGIVTDYSFSEVQLVKGHEGDSSIQLTFLGGSVGDESLLVSGAPKFTIGVRYVVFSVDNGKVMFPLVGGSQGIFQVRTESDKGHFTVFTYGGLPLVGTSEGPVVVLATGDASSLQAEAPSIPESLSLEDFLSLVRQRVLR